MEKFTIGNEPVVVHVVNLERESKFLFLRSSSRKRIESLHELKERNVSIFIFVEHSNDSLHERVLGKLRDVEELLRLKSATLILIDLTEILVKFLKLFFGEVEVFKLLLLTCKLTTQIGRAHV